MNKWLRKYKLTIGTTDGSGDIVVTPPLTIVFDAVRQSSGSFSTLNLQIFNLSYNNRKRIFQDIYQTNGPLNYKPIKLEAGYGDNLSTIYKGNYFSASSVREGSNIVTYVNGFDGGWDGMNIKTYTTLTGGMLTTDILKRLAGDFQHLTLGKIAPSKETALRPVVLEGNTWDLMRKYSKDQVFIDKEVINVHGPQYALAGSVPLLKSQSGLLSTPRREGAQITVTLLLAPDLVLGEIVNLQSTVQPEYNGQYKIVSVRHTGTISEAVNGKCITTLLLQRPDASTGGFQTV